MTDTTADGQTVDLSTFAGFLTDFAGGELAAELTTELAKAVKATNNHGGKSKFAVSFTVEQVDESMFGTLMITPTVIAKPARAPRASIYETDLDTGQLTLG
jgi:hypothetical protein